MAVSVSFPSATPKFALPLLFSGQAQKEFFLNHSFSVVDALLQISVMDSISTPPLVSSEGECYRVTSPADGEWTGHEDEIAVFISGAWTYVAPSQGMTVYDRNIGASIHYDSSWQTAIEPGLPTGGTTVDAEARLALEELILALKTIGILANPS